MRRELSTEARISTTSADHGSLIEQTHLAIAVLSQNQRGILPLGCRDLPSSSGQRLALLPLGATRLTQGLRGRTALVNCRRSQPTHHWLRGAAPGGPGHRWLSATPSGASLDETRVRTTAPWPGARGDSEAGRSTTGGRAGRRTPCRVGRGAVAPLLPFLPIAVSAGDLLRLQDHQVVLAVLTLAEGEKDLHQQTVGGALVHDDDRFR